MGKITVNNIKDDIYGNMVSITNEIIEIKASLDFGPRILSYNLCKMGNMFYNDLSKSNINDTAFPEFGGEILKAYGGHRLWISPEIMPRCYYPDNYPVKLDITETGIILTAPVEKYNNIQKIIELRLNENDSEVTVIHTIKNTGPWNVVYAPWALTVMDAGGTLVAPQTDTDTGFVGNRIIGLWPYSKMNDGRVYWGDSYIVLKQDASYDYPFKFGTNNEKGWAAYFNKGQMFLKRYIHDTEGFYPDFGGCSFESFTNDKMLEVESLGTTKAVAPNDAVVHEERWSLFNESFIPEKDEDKITEVIAKYIK